MNEEQLWKTANEFLTGGNNIVLVVIIQRIGSAPNVPGAKMLVTADRLIGTVGGGISEHTLAEQARDLLSRKRTSVEIVHLDHSEDAQENRSGMICSGSQKFALIPLGPQDSMILEEISKVYFKAKPGVLTITIDGITFEKERILQKDNIFSEKDSIWKYEENVGFQNRLVVIGGGHVSLALSRIMETLDFHITVIDDRKDLPTMISNSFAHERLVISYDDILTHIPEGENVYVTLMTFGHVSDEFVLEKLISKNYKYIGMMASMFKKQQVFASLEKKGITEDLLNTVHSPIGLKIKSDTPEEIAVSIAAEIIAVKNAD